MCGSGLGMLWPKHLFADGESTLVERKRFLGVSLHLPKSGEIMDGLCCFRMLRSQLLLPDAQGPLVEGLGLRILALLSVEVRQSMERGGHIRMVGSQLLLPNVQGALVEGLGLGIL